MMVPEYARALRLGTVRAEVGPLRQVVEVSNKALHDASEKKKRHSDALARKNCRLVMARARARECPFGWWWVREPE